ncbi:glycosyltransferase family 9 protein [Arenibacter sp. GZD96]|uniref:glycosyltransferase family 9 protein n=1 Tax=Aurantibrevibacter litoralis TaxID=3106030 RepID=UPI002AFFCCFF|nr:glycosyltransferase family 9 protein [Arenibacter sp. GZD-96]MEA1786436.1 glycosyltransferase family 9 protein [Arenibacter sp. GZD-96]
MVKSKKTADKTPHLLIIRLSAMGDVAMLVPVILSFTERYPRAKITVLTRPFFAPMFTPIPQVKVYCADVKGRHKGVFGLWKLYKELKEQHITQVLDMHNVLRSTILGVFLKMGGVTVIKIDKGRSEKRALTRGKNKVFQSLKSTHERYADVFRKSGFPLELAPKAVLHKQALTPKSSKFLGRTEKRKVIAIAPFAAFPGKMYPLFLMEEVLRLLKNTKRYRIILFGGGAIEKDVLQKWANQFSGCVNAAGTFSFEQELALISHVDLMVAMDSGNAHLAAMYGVPVITLWGVTHPFAGFYPYAQDPHYALLADRKKFPQIPTSVYGNKMPSGYDTVMETIPPSAVVQKIETILQ